MKFSQIAVVFLWSLFSAAAPAIAAGKPDPTLLGLNWFVHYCKDLNTKSDCTDNRKLRPGTRFGLHRDEDNDYWLNIQLQKPKSQPPELLMKLSLPIETIEWETPQGGPPKATFSFSDFNEQGAVVSKTMTVSLLRNAGQPTTGKSCAESLSEHSRDKLEAPEREAQCEPQNSSVVHWHISAGTFPRLAGEDSSEINALGPPGDGQGSGSDKPPE